MAGPVFVIDSSVAYRVIQTLIVNEHGLNRNSDQRRLIPVQEQTREAVGGFLRNLQAAGADFGEVGLRLGF